MSEPTAQPDDLTGAWQPKPQVPWCCTGRGYVFECPLCPEYGTSLLDPCPGHEASEENQNRAAEARLHAERRHPDYEYATTRGPRKQWDDADRPPAGENADPDYTWEPNLDAGHPGAGWERFDYHEEAYWRRPKTRSGVQAAQGGSPEPSIPDRDMQRLAAAILRVQALVDEHPVAVPTNLLEEALDQDAHDTGPSVAECAKDDRAWDIQKAGQ